MNYIKVKANDLKYSKLQITEIETYVSNILSSIDDSIEEAHNNGNISVEVPLPFSFDVPNMNRLDAKKKIYSLVVEDLTSPQRGFLVRLYMKADESKIYITWMTEEDELLREHEKDIIEFYSLPWADRKNKQRPASLPFMERIKHYKAQY
jgi:hypothetical protein